MKNPILNKCQKLVPNVHFKESSRFFWSPTNRIIHFNKDKLTDNEGMWALIHETSHAILGHTTYNTDFELLLLESEAWENARLIGEKIHIKLSSEYYQTCLDTYRDWLYVRSTCPECCQNSLQTKKDIYRCINCSTEWRVSTSRFCRQYKKLVTNKTPPHTIRTVFY